MKDLFINKYEPVTLTNLFHGYIEYQKKEDLILTFEGREYIYVPQIHYSINFVFFKDGFKQFINNLQTICHNFDLDIQRTSKFLKKNSL